MKKLKKQLKEAFKSEGIKAKGYIDIEIRLWLLQQSKNELLVKNGYLMFDDHYQALAPAQEEDTWNHHCFLLKYQKKKFAKKSIWQSAVDYYFHDIPDRFRLYQLSEDGYLITNQPKYFPNRQEVFENYLRELTLENKRPYTLEEDQLFYYIKNEHDKLQFDIPKDLPHCSNFELHGYRSKIRMKVRENYQTLFEQIGNGFEKRPLIKLEALSERRRYSSELSGLTHVIGALGSGKSNFKLASAYDAVKENKMKCGIVETDVNHVLETVNWLTSNGIKAVPLVGLTTQDTHLENLLNQSIDPTKNEIDFKSLISNPSFKYLSGTCPLLERCDAPINSKPICSHILDSEGNRIDCPMGLVCGKYQMYRDLNEAEVIVTTPHNLVKGKLPSIFEPYGRSVYEYFYDVLDLIVIDEVDEVQSILDGQFIEHLSLNQGPGNLRNDLMTYKQNLIHYQLVHQTPSAHRFVQGILKFEIILDNVQYLLSHQQYLRAYLRRGTFNAYSLGQELINGLDLNEQSVFAKQIKTFTCIEDNLDHSWFDVMASSYEKVENPFSEWMTFVNQLFTKYLLTLSSRKNENLFKEKILLLLSIKSLEVMMTILKNEYELLIEKLGREWDKIDAFSNKALKISKWVDAPVLKTLDGFYLSYHDYYRIEMLAYKGVGRTLLTKWSELKSNLEGPAVVVLSGTSVAPGSAHYHFHQEPDYLLNSHHEEGKIEMIYQPFYWMNEKSKKQELLYLSGKREEERVGILQKMTKSMLVSIRQELSQNKNIIIVVNRYEDCEVVTDILKSEKFNLAYVGKSDNQDKDCITKEQLESFETITKGARICIVPLSIIARGYNILNEAGDSYFNTMFFMIRPYLTPGDIDSYIKMLHYYQPLFLEEVTLSEYSIANRKNELTRCNYAKFREIVQMSYWSKLNENEKKIVAWYMFIPIKQAIGRMQRNGTSCKVYFIDGSFCKAKGEEKIQTLENSMFIMWEKMIYEELHQPVIRALYGNIHQSIDSMIKQIDAEILDWEEE